MTPYEKGALRFAIILSVVMALLFIVLHVADGSEVRTSCATVRPESSRMACHYAHGDYGHAARHQTYPRHFKRLALRAHTRYVRHHPGKVALSNAAWWSRFTSNDNCIGYYAAKSKCPANGVTANKTWMNRTVDIVDLCGGMVVLAYFTGPASTTWAGAALGSGTPCFWGVMYGWRVWK